MGVGGRPLAYVIQADATVKPKASDPIFGDTDSVYTSVRKEVIAHASLTGTSFSADNKKVFEILKDAIDDFEDIKVWIKGHIRSKNGRTAWMAFKAHYLGDAQLDGIAERADQRIESLVYNGERTRYTFETHVSNFKQAHLDLGKAGNEPDGRTKVRKFLQSIKAPELQTAIGVVKSQDAMLNDFEATINYLRRFVLSSTNTRNISVLGTGHVKGAGAGADPPKPPGLTYRWYQPDEWRKLPEDHKAWLRHEKKRRDKAGLNNKKKEKRRVKALIRKERRKLAKLQAKNSKKKEEDSKDNGDGEESE